MSKLELLNKGAVSAFEDEDGLVYFRMSYSNGHVIWLSDSTKAPYMYIVGNARHAELEMTYQTEILEDIVA